MPAQARSSQAIAFAVAWLAYFTALQWSVVRFRVAIVAVLTASTLALAIWQWRRSRVTLTPPVVGAALAGSALATLTVPLFSYLHANGLAVATTVLVAAPLLAAALLWSGGERPALMAAAVTALAYAAAAATAVVSDPAPKIDVWVTLQQASDALARGESFYEVTWTGSPGIKDAFTYLPWTAVLLAPGRWLAGDVRWALLVWGLVAAVGVWALAHGTGATARVRPHSRRSAAWRGAQRWRHRGGRGNGGGLTAYGSRCRVARGGRAGPGVLRAGDADPGGPGVDRAVAAGRIVWWAVLVDRGRAWWAVVPLALACASKQHLALLLPVLLVWRPFGARRAVATGALTGLLIAPWFLAGPADFVHDTITLLVSFHPIRFANTLYLLALNTFGVTLPFWVTGLVVLGTLAGVVALVRRRQPGLAELLRWLALVLLVANLVNKQAFYNQFWLVGAMVALSLAVQPRPLSER